MKEVGIILPKADLVLSSVVGPFKLFNHVNALLAEQGKDPFYNIRLVSTDQVSSRKLYDGLFSIQSTCSVHDDLKFDLIIIPSFSNSPLDVIPEHEELFAWLNHQHKTFGTEIASLCMGAFLLAPSGLLDNKVASTHWMGAELFLKLFPTVKLQMEKIITDEAGIYTSGGAYSFLNLLLHLIEKFNGRSIALYVSKVFEIDVDRSNQSTFVIFSSQKDHGDEVIKEVQQYMEAKFADKISVEEIAQKFALSRRNFIRRFKNATANTPLEYIQRVRVEAAKKLLETELLSISEVMSKVGYKDEKAFRQIFKKHAGLSPINYKHKYGSRASLLI